MRKLKNWFLLKFLPAWAKESVYKENQQLKEELDRLRAYTAGLEYALKRRVVIKNEVKQ